MSTFICGGSKSGKSMWAQRFASRPSILSLAKSSAAAAGPGFFARIFSRSKPRLYDFASPVVKKRKRPVVDIDRAARDDKWSSAR